MGGNDHHVGGGKGEIRKSQRHPEICTSVFSPRCDSVSSVYTSASAGPSIIFKPTSSMLADVLRGHSLPTATGVGVKTLK